MSCLVLLAGLLKMFSLKHLHHRPLGGGAIVEVMIEEWGAWGESWGRHWLWLWLGLGLWAWTWSMAWALMLEEKEVASLALAGVGLERWGSWTMGFNMGDQQACARTWYEVGGLVCV